MFAWKTVAEMTENQDLGRGPPNITSSGSFEMVGLSTLIQEQLQLTLAVVARQMDEPTFGDIVITVTL